MTILPLILNLAVILCGLAVASCAFNPKATPTVRGIFAVVGGLCIFRGVW